jgi:hypothetical protein
VQLIHFVLMTLGVTYIVTQSKLTKLPRQKLVATTVSAVTALNLSPGPIYAARALVLGFVAAVLTCPPCFGFWAGAAASVGGYWPYQAVHYAPVEAGLAGCVLGALWGAWGPQDVES